MLLSDSFFPNFILPLQVAEENKYLMTYFNILM